MADDDQTQSVITDEGGPTWQESMAGDNLERLEGLNKFETQDAFFDHYDGMVNRN